MKRKLPIVFLLAWLSTHTGFTQTNREPAVRTNQPAIRMYLAGKKDNINLGDSLPPQFDYRLAVPTTGASFAVVSEKDSIHFILKPASTARFLIINDVRKDTMRCLFTGIVQPASFNEAYVKLHTGKTFGNSGSVRAGECCIRADELRPHESRSY